jgi:hypothetical protein
VFGKLIDLNAVANFYNFLNEISLSIFYCDLLDVEFGGR